jgi:hypothetical protein
MTSLAISSRQVVAIVMFSVATVLVPVSSDAHRPAAAASSIIRLEISGDGQGTLATAVLVHREAREQDVVLYLLTSAEVQRRLGSRGPNVRTAGSQGLVTEGVVLSSQTALDIAVLKIVTRESALVPAPVSFESPHPGERVVVQLNDGDGLTSRLLNVRMVSTRFVIGDQDLSALPGCLGAPAFQGDAVFGVVAECLPGRPALIALLGGAESFLRKNVPGFSMGKQTQ